MNLPRRGKRTNVRGSSRNAKGRNFDRPGGNRRQIPGGGTWLYGIHAVAAALDNPARTIRRIVYADSPMEARVERPVQPEKLDRSAIDDLLPPGAVHQGHAALVDPLPVTAIEDLCALAKNQPEALVVVLDQVNDPQNIGAILRSAAVFGALGVIVQDRHAPEITGTMAKAASGAVERVPLVRVTNIVRALEILQDAGFWGIGLDSESEKSIEELSVNGRNILILGAEGPGLRRLSREACDILVRIGGRQTGEQLLNSLNVSNAAAVALYALSRNGDK